MKLALKYIFVLILLFGISHQAFPQKKKTKYREISSSDRRKAEILFTQGQKYFILNDYDKSFGLFSESLEIDPVNPAAHFKIAQIFISKDNLELALPHAQTAVELNKENKYYFLLLSEIYTKQGQFELAANVMREMIEEVEDTDQYFFELAALYLYKGDLESALGVYEEIEGIFGISDQVTYQKQSIYLKLNELDKALEEGEKLIEAYPNESLFTLKQAEILLSNSLENEALDLLKSFESKKIASPEVNMLIGEIFQRKNQHDSAFVAYKKAFKAPQLELSLKLDIMARYIEKLPNDSFKPHLMELSDLILENHSDNSNTYAIAGDLFLKLEEFDKAVGFYKTSVKLDPSNFPIWQNILNLETNRSNYDSVIYYSEKALEYFPNQSSIYFFNGNAYLISNRYEEAAYSLEQAALMGGSNASYLSVVYAQLGTAYHELEDFKASDESFEKSLEYNPDNYLTLNNYAYFLSLRKENLQQAKRMSYKAIKGNPNDANYLDTYAWVMYMMDDLENAKKYLEKALKIASSGAIMEHYGDVMFKMGNVDEAVEYWKKARGKDTTSELLDKKIADRKLYE